MPNGQGYFQAVIAIRKAVLQRRYHAARTGVSSNSFTGLSQSTLQRFAANNPNGLGTFGYESFGGANLAGHARRSETLVIIRAGNWDYVVLQDDSLQSVRHSESFVKGVEHWFETFA